MDEQQATEHMRKVLGLNYAEDEYVPSESETEIERDVEVEENYERLAMEEIQNELTKKYSRVTKSPLSEFLGRRIMNITSIIRMYQRNVDGGYTQPATTDFLKEWETLKDYNKKLLDDPIDPEDNCDPVNLRAEAHNATLFDLREGLTKAVGQRKEQALPLAIKIFNQI